jgi:hypothetical protein
MDTIKSVGYSSDGTFKNALKSRKNPIELETFYNAVNQVSSNCFSCCKQETHYIRNTISRTANKTNCTFSL